MWEVWRGKELLTALMDHMEYLTAESTGKGGFRVLIFLKGNKAIDKGKADIEIEVRRGQQIWRYKARSPEGYGALSEALSKI